MRKLILFLIGLTWVVSAFCAPASASPTQWVLISNINNEPQYWDVTHIKYSVLPDGGGVLVYINIKSVYTYYSFSFDDRPSQTVGVGTQLMDSFIFDYCKKYKNGKSTASGALVSKVSDGKTLCSIRNKDKFYQILYQGSMLIKNNHLSTVSPPVEDVTMVVYVNDRPIMSLVTPADPKNATPVDLYTQSSAKASYMGARYNKMAETINTYFLPEINKNSQLKLNNMDLITLPSIESADMWKNNNSVN